MGGSSSPSESPQAAKPDQLQRGRQRLRRAGASAILGVGAKGIQLVTLVVTVPLLYTHLGPERYGLWAVLTAINALLAFADLGLGNGLTTLLAQAAGREDRDGARRLVGGALLATGLLALALLLLGAILLPTLSWPQLLGVDGTAAAGEATAAIAVALGALVLAVPTGLAARIRLGLQQGHLAALWEGSGQLLGLLALLAAVRLGAGVPVLLIAALGPPLLIQALHLATLLLRSEPWLRPQRSDLHTAAAAPVLRSGLLFLAIQASTAIAYAFDAVFCSHLHGPAAAGDLAVVQRLFVIPTVLISLALTPLWPAYGEALARGDVVWAARTFRRSLVIVALAGLAVLLATPLLAPLALGWWIGPDFTIHLPTLLACAAAVLVMGLGHAASMLCNGAGRLAFQAWCGLALLAGTLLMKPLLGHWFGPAGLPAATALVTLLTIVLPLAWLGRRILRTSSGVPAGEAAAHP